jgi:hypothetical protein
MPLRVELDVVCNVSERSILTNVLTNSRRPNEWVARTEPHDGKAIICGSGPSLEDCVAEIAAMQSKGGIIFALNGAAGYLNDHGIIPDYQVIMDAQPRTIELISQARNHLFASQVDPSLLDTVPDAILWHATYGNYPVDEQQDFPKRQVDYCLIGAHSSVGGTVPVLVHAMGYRILHIYGLDSSNRGGRSHAKHQPLNDGDFYTTATHRGKTYHCSLTMKTQAYGFVSRARALSRDGSVIHIHGDGLLPAIWTNPLSEQEKYQEMWKHTEYRNEAPGELCIDTFLDVVNPDGTIIDFGCGTGRGALKLHQAGYAVMLIDFATNSRDPQAMLLPFHQADLSKPIGFSAPFGYCTDVMEHIPTDKVGDVIENIMKAAETVFFQISTVPDSMGSIIGDSLHLSVFPHEWWKSALSGHTIQWEDLTETTSSFVVKRNLLHNNQKD